MSVLLVLLVQTAVQISTSVHLAPVLMVEHASKVMGWKLHADVPKISVDLTAQYTFLVSREYGNQHIVYYGYNSD